VTEKKKKWRNSMIYWQQKPPRILNLLVDEAIGECLDFAGLLDASWFARTYPRTAKLLTLRAWQRELVKLRAANHAPGVYRPTEYHWLILHEVLGEFSETYNEGSLPRIVHEGAPVEEIHFDGILRVFFWDLDFTIPLDELTGFGFVGTDWMGLRNAMGIAAGLPPHPAELELVEMLEPLWDEGEAEHDAILQRPSWTISPPRRVALSAASSRRKAVG
jgi:hypothetical protein